MHVAFSEPELSLVGQHPPSIEGEVDPAIYCSQDLSPCVVLACTSCGEGEGRREVRQWGEGGKGMEGGARWEGEIWKGPWHEELPWSNKKSDMADRGGERGGEGLQTNYEREGEGGESLVLYIGNHV